VLATDVICELIMLPVIAVLLTEVILFEVILIQLKNTIYSSSFERFGGGEFVPCSVL
jgi:hypothetical protein